MKNLLLLLALSIFSISPSFGQISFKEFTQPENLYDISNAIEYQASTGRGYFYLYDYPFDISNKGVMTMLNDDGSFRWSTEIPLEYRFTEAFYQSSFIIDHTSSDPIDAIILGNVTTNGFWLAKLKYDDGSIEWNRHFDLVDPQSGEYPNRKLSMVPLPMSTDYRGSSDWNGFLVLLIGVQPITFQGVEYPAGILSIRFNMDGTLSQSTSSKDLETPLSFLLNQNYPNPFNPSTVISYSLPTPSNVELDVYDLTGRMVKKLESGLKSSGTHSITFDGSDLSSGLYVYALRANGFSDVKKMTLIK